MALMVDLDQCEADVILTESDSRFLTSTQLLRCLAFEFQTY